MSATTRRRSEIARAMPSGARRNRRYEEGAAGDTVRAVSGALAALAGLVALLIGVPILLIALGQALPLDPGVLTSLQWADDGTLLLLVLLGLAWVAWAALAFSVALEAWSAVRRIPTPRVPGLAAPQRAAAVLVAALTIGITPGGISTGTSAGAVDGLDLHATGSLVSRVQSSVSATEPAATEPATTDLRDAPSRVAAAEAGAPASDTSTPGGPTPDLPTITTRRHDTLWLLAEQHLGDGARFPEIVDLNAGVRQPDGRALGPNGRIYPGWVLRLPADADVDAARPDRHRVVVGDTLWAIAEDELGDPLRYPEVFQANAGDLQPDGRRLEDPDLIRPGWVLEIPGSIEDMDAAGRADRGDRPGGIQPGEIQPGEDDVEESAAGRSDLDPAVDPAAEERADRDQPVEEGDGPVGEVPILERGVPEMGGWEDGVDDVAGAAGTDAAGSAGTRGVGPGLAEEPDAPMPPLDRSTESQARPAPTVSAPTTQSGARAQSGARPQTDASLQPEALAEAPAQPEPQPEAPAEAPAQPEPQPEAESTVRAEARAERGSQSEVHPQPQPEAQAPESPEAEGAFLVPAGGTLAALLLAGLVREVTRRRRQFQRHRQPGERMPVAPDTRALESLARSAAAEDGPDLLEQALGQLAAEARAAGARLPAVRTVRVSTTSVRLDLAPVGDAPTPLPPFVRAAEHVWQLDPALLSPPDEELARAFPGLVTVGVHGDEAVLVNLAELGTLVVEGPRASLPGVLRALASEIVLGPAQGQVSPTLCLGDTHLTEAIAAAMEAGDVAVEPDPSRAAGILTSAFARGTSDHAVDPIEVILTDRDLGMTAGSQSGAALVTTAPAASPGGALVLDGAGGAVLRPDGIALVPQSLAASAVSQLSALLAATDVPPGLAAQPDVEPGRGHDPVWRSDPVSEPARDVGPASTRTSGADPMLASAPRRDPDRVPTPAPRPAGPAAHDAASDDVVDRAPDGALPRRSPRVSDGAQRASDTGADPRAPRVLLLGEIEVENATGKAESTRVGRLAETAAFVLLHPGSRPSELQSALWPGRRSNPQTCRQMISRTRTWLGRAADGAPYLLPFSDTGGRLRLRDEVGSDWADFQDLAARGLADPSDVDNLTAALHLVRGRPFGAVAAREIPWADLAINDMVSLITDVAHELAVRHERAGRLHEARAAALRGLLTESESEVLEAIVARTARRSQPGERHR